MSLSKFDWVIDNIKNKTSGQYIIFPNQKKSLIMEVAGVKLGIIGLTTQETPTSTNIELTDLQFDNYEKIIKEESNKLKKEGVNAIIVLGHL